MRTNSNQFGTLVALDQIALEVSALIRISQISNGSNMRLLVEGRLSGGWVDVLETSWLEAQSERDGKPLCIDLSGVTYIDVKGRELLVRIIHSGSELRAAGVMTKAVVEEITKEVEGKGKRMK
jgi:anti-anti-sigma regulatory factor